jgi:predicted phage terminase large subunit-like protein
VTRDCRRVIQSAWYRALFPATRLSARHAVNDFTTTHQGVRMATSVGGVLTGRGADFIFLDDPLKPDEALSEVQRNSANEWFEHTALSRLNNKDTGCIVIVMQRLHQDDLVGHVFGATAYAPPPGTDKLMRLHAQTAASFEGGFVLLPRQAPWLDAYVHELTGFPGTKYDDQVDSTTQALDHLGTGNSLEVWTVL